MDDLSCANISEAVLGAALERNQHCVQLRSPVCRQFLKEALTPKSLTLEDSFLASGWPRMGYRRRPDAERSSCHWGQLKLFESELRCLTEFERLMGTAGPEQREPLV